MTIIRRQSTRTTVTLGPLPVALAVMLATSGCKTGTATSKPSWWAFGGGDAAKLAPAPAYDKGTIEKPSLTSKPYPVTSSPQPYSLANAPRAATSSAPPADLTATPPAVTYGVTPSPRAQPVATPVAQEPAGTAAAGQPAALATITPQVGPYSNLPAEPVAAGGGTGEAGGARFRSGPPDRYADARPADSWSAPVAAVQPSVESRYAEPGDSRFGGVQQPAEMPDLAVPPAARPAGFSAAEQQPQSFPGAAAAAPAVAAPASAPAALPAPPASAPPAASPMPTRRPDPMYRPGGTSSYRPGKEILVGSNAGTEAAVRPVSFEAPVAGQ